MPPASTDNTLATLRSLQSMDLNLERLFGSLQRGFETSSGGAGVFRDNLDRLEQVLLQTQSSLQNYSDQLQIATAASATHTGATRNLNSQMRSQGELSQELSLSYEDLVKQFEGTSAGATSAAADMGRLRDESEENIKTTKSLSAVWNELQENLKEKFPVSSAFAAGALWSFGSALSGVWEIAKMGISIVNQVVESLWSIGKAILALPITFFDILVEKSNALASGSSEWHAILQKIRIEYGSLKEASSAAVISMAKARGSLAGTGIKEWRVFGTRAEAAGMILELTKGMGAAFDNFTQQMEDSGRKIPAFAKGLGLTGEEFRALADSATRTGKDLLTASTDFHKINFRLSRDFSVSSHKIAKDVAKAMADMKNFGGASQKQIHVAAVYARRLGLELEKITGTLEAFSEYETSAENVSKLNQALSVNLSAIELLEAQDAGTIFDKIKKAMHEAGVDAEKLDRHQISLIASSTGLDAAAIKTGLAMKNQGVSLEKIAQAADEAEKRQIDHTQALKELADSMDELTKSGSRSGGFLKQFFEGFAYGFERTRTFRGLMRNMIRSMTITRLEGRRLGRAFMEYFPGVKKFFEGLRELFDPRRFKRMVGGIVDILKNFFQEAASGRTSVPELMKKMRDKVMEFFSSNSGSGSKILEGFKSFFKAVSAIAASALRWVSEQIRDGIKYIMDLISGKEKINDGGAVSWLGQVLEPIGEAFIYAYEVIKPMFLEFLDFLWKKLSDFWDETLWPGIKQLAADATPWVLLAMTISGAISAAFTMIPMLLAPVLASVGTILASKIGGAAATTSPAVAATAAASQIPPATPASLAIGKILGVTLVIAAGIALLALIFDHYKVEFTSVLMAVAVVGAAALILIPMAKTLAILGSISKPASVSAGTIFTLLGVVTGLAAAFGLLAWGAKAAGVTYLDVLNVLGVVGAASLALVPISYILIKLGVTAPKASAGATLSWKLALVVGGLAAAFGLMAWGANAAGVTYLDVLNVLGIVGAASLALVPISYILIKLGVTAPKASAGATLAWKLALAVGGLALGLSLVLGVVKGFGVTPEEMLSFMGVLFAAATVLALMTVPLTSLAVTSAAAEAGLAASVKLVGSLVLLAGLLAVLSNAAEPAEMLAMSQLLLGLSSVIGTLALLAVPLAILGAVVAKSFGTVAIAATLGMKTVAGLLIVIAVETSAMIAAIKNANVNESDLKIIQPFFSTVKSLTQFLGKTIDMVELLAEAADDTDGDLAQILKSTAELFRGIMGSANPPSGIIGLVSQIVDSIQQLLELRVGDVGPKMQVFTSVFEFTTTMLEKAMPPPEFFTAVKNFTYAQNRGLNFDNTPGTIVGQYFTSMGTFFTDAFTSARDLVDKLLSLRIPNPAEATAAAAVMQGIAAVFTAMMPSAELLKAFTRVTEVEGNDNDSIIQTDDFHGTFDDSPAFKIAKMDIAAVEKLFTVMSEKLPPLLRIVTGDILRNIVSSVEGVTPTRLEALKALPGVMTVISDIVKTLAEVSAVRLTINEGQLSATAAGDGGVNVLRTMVNNITVNTPDLIGLLDRVSGMFGTMVGRLFNAINKLPTGQEGKTFEKQIERAKGMFEALGAVTNLLSFFSSGIKNRRDTFNEAQKANGSGHYFVTDQQLLIEEFEMFKQGMILLTGFLKDFSGSTNWSIQGLVSYLTTIGAALSPLKTDRSGNIAVLTKLEGFVTSLKNVLEGIKGITDLQNSGLTVESVRTSMQGLSGILGAFSRGYTETITSVPISEGLAEPMSGVSEAGHFMEGGTEIISSTQKASPIKQLLDSLDEKKNPDLKDLPTLATRIEKLKNSLSRIGKALTAEGVMDALPNIKSLADKFAELRAAVQEGQLSFAFPQLSLDDAGTNVDTFRGRAEAFATKLSNLHTALMASRTGTIPMTKLVGDDLKAINTAFNEHIISSLEALQETVSKINELGNMLNVLEGGRLKVGLQRFAQNHGMGGSGKFKLDVPKKDVIVNLQLAITMDAGEMEKMLLLRSESFLTDRLNEFNATSVGYETNGELIDVSKGALPSLVFHGATPARGGGP